MPRRSASLALLALAAMLPMSSCQLADEAPGSGTDLVIRNGGTINLGKLSVNGVDQGPLPAGGVLTLEDVGARSFVIQAFVDAANPLPCQTWETGALARGESAHHTFDCARH